MNFTRSTTLKALVAGTIAAATCSAAVALPAQGASSSTTIKYRSVARESDQHSIDVAPAGDSLGDRNVASLTLTKYGKTAGRLSLECVTLDKTYEGHLCSGIIILRRGSLTLSGGGVNRSIPNVGFGGGDVFAIDGGTGAYARARGTMEVGEDGIVTVVIQ